MKVVVDLIWGGLLIAAFALTLAYFMKGDKDLVMLALMLAGIAAGISMAEQYEANRRKEHNNRFKR